MKTGCDDERTEGERRFDVTCGDGLIFAMCRYNLDHNQRQQSPFARFASRVEREYMSDRQVWCTWGGLNCGGESREVWGQDDNCYNF